MPWLRITKWAALVFTLALLFIGLASTQRVATLMTDRFLLQANYGNFAVGWGGHTAANEGMQWFWYVPDNPRIVWETTPRLYRDYRGGQTCYMPGWMLLSTCSIVCIGLWSAPVLKRRKLGLCPQCGYPSAGIATGKCPECGRQFT